MTRSLLLILFIPFNAIAHPGIGIVKDSKGNIYYTDLEKVWKITNGKKTMVVSNMHTHELWIDRNDNLFGENQIYMDEGTNRFDHFLWVLRTDGRLDTVVKRTRAFVRNDYSLNRDADGNEYYVKEHTLDKDVTHIYTRSVAGKEEIFATADVKGVNWIYPLKDGSVIYVSKNNIYKAKKGDTARLLISNIADAKPRFAAMSGPVVYGMWEDKAGDIYVAVYSDQAIKKISADGSVRDVYRSAEHWGPTNGVFDNHGKLWVLETSDKNEVRVTEASDLSPLPAVEKEKSNTSLWLFISAGVTILIMVVVLLTKRRPQNATA